MKKPTYICLLTMTAWLAVAPMRANAAVSTFFSAGAGCTGPASANFADSGPAVKVSLCATATANEKMCGFSVNLRSANTAESGRFAITAVLLSASYPDPNSSPAFPVLITNPPGVNDFGGTVAVTSVPAIVGQNQLLATFDLTPQAGATNNAYVVSSGGASALSIDTDGACLNAIDAPLAASVIMNRSTATPVTPTVPGAPVIGSVVAGNQSVTVNFSAAADGGSPISTYRATCNPGAFNSAGSSAPLIVTGLANGTTYSCSVTATNAVGTGPASAAMNVTPVAAVSGAALNYSDLWWAGTAENGWGMTVQQHGNVQFNVLFVYDATGKPIWYAMPGCTWNADFTVCNGQLAKPTSSPLNNYNAAQFVPGGAVGTISLNYTSANTATLQYVINGIPGQKTIQRQSFGPVDNTPGLQVGDMWWAGDSQNGWGVSITQQFRTLFAAWYTYDQAGNVTWYTMPGGSWNGNTYSGGLAAVTSSPWLGTTYNPALFAPSQVGTVSFAFQDANNATMTYTFTSGPFAGTTQSKQITRQPY